MKNAMQYVSFYGKDIDNVKPTGELMRRNVILLNSDVIPNAPYFTFTWYLRTTEELQVQHTHDFDEIIGFVGCDPDDPENLNGVVEFMVDGEWVVLERSAVLFIPAGVKHCPYRISRLDKPIIHFSGAGVGVYRALQK